MQLFMFYDYIVKKINELNIFLNLLVELISYSNFKLERQLLTKNNTKYQLFYTTIKEN